MAAIVQDFLSFVEILYSNILITKLYIRVPTDVRILTSLKKDVNIFRKFARPLCWYSSLKFSAISNGRWLFGYEFQMRIHLSEAFYLLQKAVGDGAMNKLGICFQ